MANKEYYFTIIGSLKVWNKVIYKYTAFSSAYSIIRYKIDYRLNVSNKKAQYNVIRQG